MSTKENLWPEFKPKKLISPKTLMIEQANFLGEATKNVIVGEVVSNAEIGKPNKLLHSFRIIAPALNNYKFTLFFVQHDVLFYPLVFNYQGKSKKIESEQQFIDAMKDVFNSEYSMKIISSLYSQSIE